MLGGKEEGKERGGRLLSSSAPRRMSVGESRHAEEGRQAPKQPGRFGLQSQQPAVGRVLFPPSRSPSLFA